MSMSKQERQKEIESLSRLGAERLAAVIVDALEGISERRRSTDRMECASSRTLRSIG